MIITREWVNTVAPKHGRTTCSDDNRINGYGGALSTFDQNTGEREIRYPRCNRCYLLDHIGCDTSDLEFEIEVSVSLKFKTSTIAPRYKDGDISTGPNGMPIIFRNGSWKIV